MAKKTAALLPPTAELLREFGERLRLARLRRQLSARQVAERAGMAPMTLRSLERGGAGVTMGAYLSVMQVLGIEKDLDLLGKADPLGRQLQDARLSTQDRTRKAAPPPASKRASAVEEPSNADEAQAWSVQEGYTSADSLAGLIDPSPPPRTRGR